MPAPTLEDCDKARNVYFDAYATFRANPCAETESDLDDAATALSLVEPMFGADT